MTYEEIRQTLKNEALNNIIHIHSKYFKYEYIDDMDDDFYGDSNHISCGEERDNAVKRELDDLDRKLKKLKLKNQMKNK